MEVLRVDQVYVIRHKRLVEGVPVRRIAARWGSAGTPCANIWNRLSRSARYASDAGVLCGSGSVPG